jgi:uncharacterized membrane protein
MILIRRPFAHLLHLRLLPAGLCGLLVGGLLPATLVTHAVTRWLIAWNAGALVYLAAVAIMMVRSGEHHMRLRARAQDEGAWVILVLVAVAGITSLAAIGVELALVRDAHGLLRVLHALLAAATVLMSWAFIQTLYALHYAHAFYQARERGETGGLQFPGEPDPDYFDFLYFSVVIGTSGQTADVSFESRSLRRVGTLHCALSYLFNTTVLALLINISASLL